MNETAQACSLLLHVPVGSFKQTGKLLRANVKQWHRTLEDYCDVSVFLNHYEGDAAQENWVQLTDQW